jgi:hypothetical protein
VAGDQHHPVELRLGPGGCRRGEENGQPEGDAGAPPAETLKDTPNHRVVRSAPSPDDPAARTMDQDARRAQSAVFRVFNPHNSFR